MRAPRRESPQLHSASRGTRASTAAPAGLERSALVLAGGNALGAFEARACRMLNDEGVCPEWIVGSSIGAVNGAIIAGNPVEARNEALRRFWSDAALPGCAWAGEYAPAGDAAQRLPGQLQAMLFGTPAVFVPNYRGMIARQPSEIGLYDLSPLRRSLGNHVDFDLPGSASR